MKFEPLITHMCADKYYTINLAKDTQPTILLIGIFPMVMHILVDQCN